MRFVDRLLASLDRFIPQRYGAKFTITRENIPQQPIDDLDERLQEFIEEDR